jgi:hypothetical protein
LQGTATALPRIARIGTDFRFTNYELRFLILDPRCLWAHFLLRRFGVIFQVKLSKSFGSSFQSTASPHGSPGQAGQTSSIDLVIFAADLAPAAGWWLKALRE